MGLAAFIVVLEVTVRGPSEDRCVVPDGVLLEGIISVELDDTDVIGLAG